MGLLGLFILAKNLGLIHGVRPLVTHDHFDHCADAADISRKTGATLIGQPETVGRLKSLAEGRFRLQHAMLICPGMLSLPKYANT